MKLKTSRRNSIFIFNKSSLTLNAVNEIPVFFKKTHRMIFPICCLLLFIVHSLAATPPMLWQDNANFLLSTVAPSTDAEVVERMWPPVSNGFLGFVAHSERLYVRGVFNGLTWTPDMTKFENLSHNALLPPWHNINFNRTVNV